MERPLIDMHHELLFSIAAERDRIGDLELTSFAPLRGKEYSGELMVVGRAVNGWCKQPWTAIEAGERSRHEEIVRDALEPYKSACPMAWVADRWGREDCCAEHDTDYNTKRSPFWRLIRGVTQRLLGSSTDWPSQLAWSNLYKIAPHAGGNPPWGLCKIQQQICERYLATEVKLWKPKRVLFVTGWEWASPFLGKLLGRAVEGSTNTLLKFSSLEQFPDHRASIVVCVRPEGKQDQRMIDEVARAFTE